MKCIINRIVSQIRRDSKWNVKNVEYYDWNTQEKYHFISYDHYHVNYNVAEI